MCSGFDVLAQRIGVERGILWCFFCDLGVFDDVFIMVVDVLLHRQL